MCGGIIGDLWSLITILDCVANVYLSTNINTIWIGSIIGWSETADGYNLENLVGKIDADTTASECIASVIGSNI